MPVNISINTNTIAIQENINHISVNDPNNPNIVDITQPITEIVEIITAGPQGPIGPSGSAGPPGSAVLSGGTNNFIPLWSGSTALTSSIIRQASGTLQISGSTSITGSLNVTNGITGSLFGTASNSTSASYALNSTSASYALNSTSASYAATASNILGGKATHLPFFITDTTLATSSIYQSGSTSVIINQDNNTTANPEALYVWQPHPTSINVISGKGNVNNYLQLNIQNTNQGTAASSDVVATADNGNETSNYIDMGINSENYNSGFIGDANDAYLYSTGKHLHIGNASDEPVMLFAGGTDVDIHNKLMLNPNNQHQMTGSLEISGSLKVNQGITGSLFGTSSRAVSASYAATASIGPGTVNYLPKFTSTTTIGNSLLQDNGTNIITGDNNFLVGSNWKIFYDSLNSIRHTTGNGWNITSWLDTRFFIGNESTERMRLTNTGLRITGSLNVSQGITGSLFGTASYVTGSIFTSNNPALSSSYALTASYVNPLIQSVVITGSLTTTGSNKLIGDTSLTGSLNITGSTLQVGSNTLIGNTILSGSIGISGSSTIQGTTTMTGSLLITGSTTQVGNNTLLGDTLLSGSITISGSFPVGSLSSSVNIYGDTAMTGYLKFNPKSTNIDTSLTASYIFVSGSTNDLYFSQNGDGYSNITRLRWLEGNLYTGLLNGGIIGTASPTIFTVSSGSGIIVNLNGSYNRNPYPSIQYVNWNNLSASIAPLSSSADWSFVAINSSSAIEVKGTPYEDGEYNTKIPLGLVLHQNRSTINGVQTFPSLAYGWKQRSFDFMKAFGPLKISGYGLSPSGSSTGELFLAGGISWVDGRNYTVDPNNPSYITEAVGISTSKIFRYHQSGSQWVYDTNGGVGYTTIDPSKYSNSGSLTPVPTNDFTIQRVYYFPNSATKALFIYYGNDHYSNIDLAKAAISTEAFAEAPNTAANAIFIGYMLLRHNADFTVAASYAIQAASLFRAAGSSGGGGGGGSTSPGGSTTQIQYNNAGAFGGVPNLTWDGTTLKATGSFSGSITNAVSASYALTASYALNGGSGGNTFPYTGSAVITGSLVVTGSTTSTQGFIKPGAGSQYLLADGTTTAGTGGSVFPYTGSALITGSLTVIGPVAITGSLTQGEPGLEASGQYSHAEGSSTHARAPWSHAEGENNYALATGSHAEGSGTETSGYASHAEGSGTYASGNWGHSEGSNAGAEGDYSHGEGESTRAVGKFSHAEGSRTIATGEGAHAEGRFTTASGYASHAEGSYTVSSGSYSHAEGSSSLAKGIYSHAEGYRTLASGVGSHAEGYFTTSSGDNSHAEGYNTIAQGESSHAEGSNTRSLIYASHTEGSYTVASEEYAHAEGYGTLASGYASHAEGHYTTSSGQYSHAEGSYTVSTGSYSHAEGVFTISSGSYSHAEGSGSLASGVGSHAEGERTKSSGKYSHAEGQYTTASGDYSHAEGLGTRATGEASHAEGIGFIIDPDIFVQIWSTNNYIETSYFSGIPEAGSNTTTLILAGDQSGGGTPPYALNSLYVASDTYSFYVNSDYYTTIPVVTSAVYNIGTDLTTFTFNPPLQSSYSFVYGTGLIASGLYSHAEGDGTKAQGTGSHAEGFNTVALGSYQHVQGQYNLSSSAQGAFIHGNGTSDAARSNLIFASGSQVQITGSLNVSGSITGSLFGTASYATNALTASYVIGGGSPFPYTGTAVITGSLIVTSTNQLDGSLTDFATVNSTIVGSNNLYTQATGSYTSAFVKYTVSKGTNSRAGEFIANWNGTTVTYFDNSTTDIGNTSDIVFNSAIVSSQIQVNATAATSGWKIKTLATFI